MNADAPVSRGNILVIGVGNEMRSDDALGLIVARKVAERCPKTISTIEQSGEGAALMASWQGKETVVVIDAVQSGAASGSLFRFDVHHEPIPRKFFHYSTHDFSVAEAIELARVLKTLPPRMIVYGVEGASFEPGIGLSPAAESASEIVVESICQDLGAGAQWFVAR